MFLKNFATMSIVLSMFVFGLAACAQGTSDGNVKLDTYKDSLSYSLGFNIGKNLSQNIMQDALNIDLDKLVDGFSVALKGEKGQLTEEEIQKVMTLFQQDLQAKQQLQAKQAGEMNLKKANEFLAENAKKPGVKTTPSGLQYKIIKEGTGKRPTDKDTVKVHYTGKLIDGKVFDSSVERGQPVEFPLGGVIKGWTEGLKLVKEGGNIILYIPPELGYGARGAGQAIPPNSALIFEVELLEVK